MIKEYARKAIAFHGHKCGGLFIGIMACVAAMEKMGISPSSDEEIVCITENDACGVDAVQALMGCTFGKGNLIFKNSGKQAFTFIKREGAQAMRFYFKASRKDMNTSEFCQYLLDAPVDELFTCTSVDISVPERARIFTSVICDSCGEACADPKIRLQNGLMTCPDCFREYSRKY